MADSSDRRNKDRCDGSAAANREPAVGAYVRGAGDTAFRPFALIVLRPQAGLLAAIDVFEAPGLFATFGLPASLDY